MMKVDFKTKSPDSRDKSFRGNVSQLFIAGELCRRGYSAVVTPSELERYRNIAGTIIRPALREGRVLHERAA